MRFEGIVTSWNDDRGFGFIEPTLGGQQIFVHITAFKALRVKPVIGLHVSFQVEIGPQGKKRALNVELVRPSAKAPPKASKENPAQWGTASLFSIPIFLIVLTVAYGLGHPPRWMLLAYPAASVLTYVVYAWDKSAARRDAWRVSENSLHLLAIIGGWPGALIAQQSLRHKSIKEEFRATFWTTVAINIAALIFLATFYGH